MKDFSIRFVFDRKNETGFRDKEKKKGVEYKEAGLLQIEVRKDGSDKRAYVSTDIRIRPDQFSDKMGFTCRNDDNSKSITGKARDRYNAVYAFVESEDCIDLSHVKYWDKADISTLSVTEFIKSEMKRNNPSYAVVEYHNSFLKRLDEFGKIKTFNDITYNNIVDFDAHLKKTIASEPTLHKRHALFKRYIQEAINRGLYKGLNPYNIFKSKKGKSKDPVFLTEDEIKLIQNYSPNYGYLERTRDLFLFQCFTGLAYVDLMAFSKDSIFESNGRKVMQSSRTKTDEGFIVPLLPEAIRIAEKYNYELPKLTNQKYNAYLKEILKDEKVNINKAITTHHGRHNKFSFPLRTSKLQNYFIQ